MSDGSLPRGLDPTKLGAWFTAEIPGAGLELSVMMIGGGKSNVTYVVADGAQHPTERLAVQGQLAAPRASPTE